MPFFSVIIPTYNRAKYIKKAIESVLNQTFSDFELIIADDASTDNTKEIVSSIKDSRIIYFKNEKNLERCITRNKGIQMAKGKYIAFLDSDDYHLPNHLEILYNEIKKQNEPEAVFFTNAYDEGLGKGRKERTCPDFEKFNPYHYILTYTFNPQRVAVHRNIFKKHLFDPKIVVCEDMDLFLRMKTDYPVIQIKERTTVYHHNMDSFTHGDALKPFKELKYYRLIFSRPELKGKLPLKSRNRLLSMTFFHIGVFYEKQKDYLRMYKYIVKSFLFYPQSYNGKTNKIMFVMFLYHLPLISMVLNRKK